MKTNRYIAAAVAVALFGTGSAMAAKECPPGIADAPIVPNSMEQADINSGALTFKDIADHGSLLFAAKFNTCDGRGRPEATGGGAKRAIPTHDDEGRPVGPDVVAKTRSSAPDSDSCSGCHAQPESGGAGDFVANVFVLAQTLDPITQDIDFGTTNDRNTLGMHGSGPIEMLAREMTVELQAAASGLADGTHTISSKGVDFKIEIAGGAVIGTDGGIDHDLVIKPFHQAGKVISLREFSDNAMNHHHGMQAEERFDLNPATGFDTDHDGDGYTRELTIGDQTAISIWQAQLSTPQQVKPKKGPERDAIDNGEQVFDDLGCTSCHVPELTISSTIFTEPNPFNPPGTCGSAAEGCPDYSFDMKNTGDGARLEAGKNGEGIIRAYTDMKRHNLCDDPGTPGAIRWFCNERLSQGRPDNYFGGQSGTEYFLTRKLWDVGNTAPYGHRGDVTTIAEAILLHGGEGRSSRDAYAAASASDQADVVKFLKSLQIVTGDVVN